MNYLELTRRLATEVGVSGHIQTVQGAEGEALRLANWIKEAWLELQLLRDTWRWRVDEFEVSVPAGQATLDTSAYPEFHRVLPDDVFGKPANTDTWQALSYVTFPDWQSLVRSRPSQTGTPVYFTERPDLTVELAPVPSTDYKVRGLYVKKAQELTNDFDVPLLPPEYHMAIVYKAMMLYAGYEAAPEIFQSAAQGFNRVYKTMVNSDTPVVLLPETLA